MGAPLKGQHQAREESPDQILRTEVGLLLVGVDEAGNPYGLLVVLGTVEPVLHGGRPGNVRRKIDEILQATVPDVKERFLPGPDRF
jgi:hypothetical protein